VRVMNPHRRRSCVKRHRRNAKMHGDAANTPIDFTAVIRKKRSTGATAAVPAFGLPGGTRPTIAVVEPGFDVIATHPKVLRRFQHLGPRKSTPTDKWDASYPKISEPLHT